MEDTPRCSSFVFQISNESEIYDVLTDISLTIDAFFVYFIIYVGSILVLANVFAIFILTRRELRTPYNIIFIVMALDQSVTIFGQNILLWKQIINFGCGFVTGWFSLQTEAFLRRFTYSFPYKVFELTMKNLCPICNAHATWLAVIITFVRLRHISSSTSEQPSLRHIILMCLLSFLVVVLVGIPQFLSYGIYFAEIKVDCDNGDRLTIPSSPIISDDRLYYNDCMLLRITYISSGVLYNALPCVLLIVLSTALAYQLSKIRKIHTNTMMGRSSAVNAESVRSSWMIAMIVFTTLIMGIPQGSLIVTLVIFASAVNLTIYLGMSKRIREITLSYLCCVCRKVNGKKKSQLSSLQNSQKTQNNVTVSTIVHS